MIRILALLLVLTGAAQAQPGQPTKQNGGVTPGHVTMWTTNGIVQDGGTAFQGFLSSLGVTASGPGICQNSGPITGPYNQLCLGVSSTAAATLTLQAFGGATQQPLNFVINGSTYSFPFTGPGTGVIGPGSSTVGHVSCWNSTTGAALSDCGVLPSTLTGFNAMFPNATIFYINSSTGNDSNDCQADPASGGHAPCLTFQHGIDVALRAAAGGGADARVTLEVNGTFNVGGFISAPPVQGAQLGIYGFNAGADAINDTTSTCGSLIITGSGTNVIIGNITLRKTAGCSGGGAPIFAQALSYTLLDTNVTFGASTGAHIRVEDGAVVEIPSTSGYKITGNAAQHWSVADFGLVLNDAETITCSGITALSQAWAVLASLASVEGNVTFSGCGSVTGGKIIASGNSIYNLEGTALSAVPGSGATYATGAQIVGAPAPTVTSCTNGAMVAGSSDDVIQLSFSGANSTCTVVFGMVKASTPVCVAQTSSTLTPSTTGFVLTGSFTTGNIDSILCHGNPN